MERGPRYNDYAQLREARLRRRRRIEEEENEDVIIEPKRSPLKKQVRFQDNFTKSRKSSSVLAQSVPDFSATLRKENRKPPAPTLELTPPAAKQWSKTSGVLSNSRGSKSANAGEKRGVMMARKSYASIDELRGISNGVAKEICGTRNGSTRITRSVLGYRQIG